MNKYRKIVLEDVSECSAYDDQNVRAMFYVYANPDPNLIQRVVGIFAKLSLVPDRIYVDREVHADRNLNIELRLLNLDVVCAQRIEKTLRSIIGVENVIMVVEAQV